MYESVEVHTLFNRESAPDVYRGIHDVHTINGNALLLMFTNGDQLGIPMSNILRWKAVKKSGFGG